LIGQCSECSELDVSGRGCSGDAAPCDRSLCDPCIALLGVHEKPFRCNWCIALGIQCKIKQRLSEMSVGTRGRYLITDRIQAAIRVPFFRRWVEEHESVVYSVAERRLILTKNAAVPVQRNTRLTSGSYNGVGDDDGEQGMFLGAIATHDDHTEPALVVSPPLLDNQNGETVATDSNSSEEASTSTTDTDTEMYTRDHCGGPDAMNRCIRCRASRYMDPSNGISVRILASLVKNYGVVIIGSRRKAALCLAVATYEIQNNLRAYNESTEEYVVEEIRGYRPGGRDREDYFRVAWEGYMGEDTWEPESGLPPGMIREFRTGMRIRDSIRNH
jgi:hypothetical protein